jgi:tetratricopeptide (TPR) repeat protein
MVGITTSNLGRVASRSGRYDEAHELFSAAEDEFSAIGNRGELLETRSRIAECLVFEERADEAIATATDALALAEELGGVPPAMPTLFRSLGAALAQRGRIAEARDALRRSLELARQRNADYEVALTLTAMRAVADALGESFPADDERERCSILERLEVRSVPEIRIALAGA